MRNRIKFWRHQLNIDTQKEFAELLGVSHTTLNRWEKQSQQPDPDALVAIWLKLRQHFPDINIQDLLDWE